MKKIHIAQYYTSNLTLGPFAEKINEKYANDNGYGYYCEKSNTEILDYLNGAAPTWYKPKLMLDVIEKFSPDYILFLDTDAIISDTKIRIEEFIDEEYNFIAAKDESSHSLMNAGVFLLKNCEWTINFLKEWELCRIKLKPSDCTLRTEVAEHDLNVEGFYSNRLWMDQTALTHLYRDKEEFGNKMKIISNRSFNWMRYNDNNFIFHAYAYGQLKNRTLDSIHNRLFNITTNINMSLNELGEHHGTDKYYYHNYYTRVYENLLIPYKSYCDILEIGVLDGASLKIWDDFFESGVVHGVDIQPKSLDYGRTECFIVDQSDEDSLKSFVENGQKYDIIVDDGSHRMKDQQITIQILFKSLKSGGYFVIEDLQTSTECRMPSKAVFGWGDPEKTTCLDMLYSIINGDPKCDYKTSEWDSFISEIEEIKLTQDREDSILATIKKK